MCKQAINTMFNCHSNLVYEPQLLITFIDNDTIFRLAIIIDNI